VGGIKWSTSHFQLSIPEVEELIRKAYKAFKVVKRTPDRWDTWIAGVIAAQANQRGCSKKSLWKQHRTTKRIHRMAQTVHKLLSDEAPRQALSMVISPGPNGERQECMEKTRWKQHVWRRLGANLCKQSTLLFSPNP